MMKLGYYNSVTENTLGLTLASIYIAVIHFTRERTESVWRKSSYLIKNFKNNNKKYDRLIQVVKPFLLESDGNLRSIQDYNLGQYT